VEHEINYFFTPLSLESNLDKIKKMCFILKQKNVVYLFKLHLIKYIRNICDFIGLKFYRFILFLLTIRQYLIDKERNKKSFSRVLYMSLYLYV